VETMGDLRAAGVDVVTIGQYLRPTARHAAVDRYVEPERFDAFAREGRAMGFAFVASGPLVRSSYKAAEVFLQSELRPAARVDPVDVGLLPARALVRRQS
jgi:lipoyl synthase